MGTLRTYQEGGHCGDGIHHLYATVPGGSCVVPTLAINSLLAGRDSPGVGPAGTTTVLVRGPGGPSAGVLQHK